MTNLLLDNHVLLWIAARDARLGERAAAAIRDPLDRMLVAQARTEHLTLVSADTRLRAYDVRVLAADV